MADTYGTNPLADELRERDPIRFDLVASFVPPPKMFQAGAADVPAFTASGIDPQHLLKLPYAIRHAAATNRDINQVYEWFETYINMPDAEVDSEGLRDARLRIEAWLRDTDTDPRSAEQRAKDDEAAYSEFYGVDNDRVSYELERARREKTGQDPLETFEAMQSRKAWQAIMRTAT